MIGGLEEKADQKVGFGIGVLGTIEGTDEFREVSLQGCRFAWSG